jgi:gas vesicle protein
MNLEDLNKSIKDLETDLKTWIKELGIEIKASVKEVTDKTDSNTNTLTAHAKDIQRNRDDNDGLGKKLRDFEKKTSAMEKQINFWRGSFFVFGGIITILVSYLLKKGF